MDDIERIAAENRRERKHSMWTAIICIAVSMVLLAVSLIMNLSDTVVKGEGQDPITTWSFLTWMGTIMCCGIGIINYHEYSVLSRRQNDGPKLILVSLVLISSVIICGILSLKTSGTYGPGLESQTYHVEEAGVTVTFPSGLSMIEETSQRRNHHRLYAFVKTRSVIVEIRRDWKPDDWEYKDFIYFVCEDHRATFSKGIFHKTTIMEFDGFHAIRTIGRAHEDHSKKFRAYYDILNGSTYVRVAVITDTMKGEPDSVFLNYCDNIVKSIRFDTPQNTK